MQAACRGWGLRKGYETKTTAQPALHDRGPETLQASFRGDDCAAGTGLLQEVTSGWSAPHWVGHAKRLARDWSVMTCTTEATKLRWLGALAYSFLILACFWTYDFADLFTEICGFFTSAKIYVDFVIRD